MRLVSLVSCLAVACAQPDPEAACKNYLDALNGCNRDYAKDLDIEPVVVDLETCGKETSGLADDEKKDAADRYDCKYDVYASAICRDAEQYKSANADAAACDE
jgi:hypothetical protein